MANPTRDTAVPSAEFAAAVFERWGLGAGRSRDASGIPTDDTRADAGALALCHALEELGGLYVAFARFLSWRADLVPGSYILHLRRVRPDVPVVPPSVVSTLIGRELGGAGRELATGLAAVPVWNTSFRSAYISTQKGQRVIVEVARDRIAEEAFQEFEKGLRALERSELEATVAPAVGQLLRNQFGALSNPVSVREWAVSSGMLMFSTLREMNRSVEELRENDITIGVDGSDWRRPPPGKTRRVYPFVLGGLVVFFLVSLQWGSTAPEPWSLVLKILAVSALPAMFWAISKIT